MRTNDKMIFEKLLTVFREVFLDEDLQIDGSTTAQDIPGWDAFVHVTLMVKVEETFGVQFDDDEIGGLADVGELQQLIAGKLG